MPLTNSRLAACRASLLVALSEAAASDASLSDPTAPGKNLLPTTPLAAQMNRLKVGFAFCAHAERSGSPSRKGKPMAMPAAPRRNARRLTATGLGPGIVDFTASLHVACGRPDLSPAPA